MAIEFDNPNLSLAYLLNLKGEGPPPAIYVNGHLVEAEEITSLLTPGPNRIEIVAQEPYFLEWLMVSVKDNDFLK